jgi:hypothetical protein
MTSENKMKAVFTLAAVLAVVGVALVVYRAANRSRRVPRPATSAAEAVAVARKVRAGTASPSPALVAHVQERVRAYREAVLRYALDTELARQQARPAAYDALLGAGQRMAACPTLVLWDPESRWDVKELRLAVGLVMEKEGLPRAGEGQDPSSHASLTCEEWAIGEAAARYRRWFEDHQEPA